MGRRCLSFAAEIPFGPSGGEAAASASRGDPSRTARSVPIRLAREPPEPACAVRAKGSPRYFAFGRHGVDFGSLRSDPVASSPLTERGYQTLFLFWPNVSERQLQFSSMAAEARVWRGGATSPRGARAERDGFGATPNHHARFRAPVQETRREALDQIGAVRLVEQVARGRGPRLTRKRRPAAKARLRPGTARRWARRRGRIGHRPGTGWQAWGRPDAPEHRQAIEYSSLRHPDTATIVPASIAPSADGVRASPGGATPGPAQGPASSPGWAQAVADASVS